ncbi:hypothetical protein BC829DRAFT_381320, partial [Chytridium lagenaria]
MEETVEDTERAKFLLDASRIIKVALKRATRGRFGHTVWHRRFSAHFGCDHETGLELWEMVRPQAVQSRLLPSRFNVSATSWRTKVNSMLTIMSNINTIFWEDRWDDWDYRHPSAYVDGVDFLVQEDRPLNKGLYSHKFKHAGYRYQVATALGSSKIVHISGGWNMVRESLVPLLDPDETIAADRGYRGEPKIMTKLNGNTAEIKKHNYNLKQMGARHETINKKIKDLGRCHPFFELLQILLIYPCNENLCIQFYRNCNFKIKDISLA